MPSLWRLISSRGEDIELVAGLVLLVTVAVMLAGTPMLAFGGLVVLLAAQAPLLQLFTTD